MRSALACAALALASVACGYALVSGSGSGSPGAADAEAIEIRMFENRSNEPGLERMLADALGEEFARRGRLRPLHPGGATPPDLALSGVVRDVRVRPSSFTPAGVELENRVEVVLEVALTRPTSGELVWRHPRLVLEELFVSSPDAQVRESNKEQALRSIAAAFAGRIHDELSQTF